MAERRWITPTVVLAVGSVVLLLSMGIRHGFGLFLQPMSLEHGWGREVFSLAIALQNIVWGFAQPFTGMLADRYGAGRVVFVGALLYAAGLWLMSSAGTPGELYLSSGLLIGLGLSGTTFSVVFGVIGRHTAPEKRSMALGIAGAVASFGQFAMVPGSQALIASGGAAFALMMLAVAEALIVEAERIDRRLGCTRSEQEFDKWLNRGYFRTFGRQTMLLRT